MMTISASGPLAISLGDPAGIGPEVVVRALAVRPERPVLVFGDPLVLVAAAERAHVPRIAPEALRVVTTLRPSEVVPGRPNDASARAQLAYLEAATDAVLGGECSALVTAPTSKEGIARAR